MWIQVTQYSGDGVIYNCSSSIPIVGALISWPGYRIEFPKFRSDRSYEASYRLSHVPQRGGRPAIVYLCFTPPDWIGAHNRKNSITAVFRIVLQDTNGHILHSAELPVGISGWTTSVWTDSKNGFGVYEPQKSYLYLAPRTSYVLNVSYIPGEVPPPARELYFSIENRGSK